MYLFARTPDAVDFAITVRNSRLGLKHMCCSTNILSQLEAATAFNCMLHQLSSFLGMSQPSESPALVTAS